MNLDFQNGEIILIDKELNWTSFDVVSKLRNSIKKKLDLKKIIPNILLTKSVVNAKIKLIETISTFFSVTN